MIVGGFIQNTLRRFEEFMIQHENDRLDEYIWPAISKHLAEVISTKGFQDYWTLQAEIYTYRFQAFVDSLEKREYRGVHQPAESDSITAANPSFPSEPNDKDMTVGCGPAPVA